MVYLLFSLRDIGSESDARLRAMVAIIFVKSVVPLRGEREVRVCRPCSGTLRD